MSEFKMSPEEIKAAKEKTKEAIKREVEYALEALRDFKEGKGFNVSASIFVGGLLDYLPSTDVNPKDFGLTADELPDLIKKYHDEAIKDAP